MPSPTGRLRANTRPQQPWDYWVTSTPTSTVCTQYVWSVWSSSTGTSTVTTTNSYWNTWANERSSIHRSPAYELFEEGVVRNAMVERMGDWAQHDSEVKAARDKAEKRAEELLLTLLNEEQKRQFKSENAFVVHGRSGLRYRIRRGRVGNVDVIERDGRLRHRLCAHPIDNVPNCDTMAAQKLMLECDDLDFARRANIHPVNPGQIILPALMQ